MTFWFLTPLLWEIDASHIIYTGPIIILYVAIKSSLGPSASNKTILVFPTILHSCNLPAPGYTFKWMGLPFLQQPPSLSVKLRSRMPLFVLHCWAQWQVPCHLTDRSFQTSAYAPACGGVLNKLILQQLTASCTERIFFFFSILEWVFDLLNPRK